MLSDSSLVATRGLFTLSKKKVLFAGHHMLDMTQESECLSKWLKMPPDKWNLVLGPQHSNFPTPLSLPVSQHLQTASYQEF